VETVEQPSGGLPARKRHDPQFIESILKLIQVDGMSVAQVSRQSGIRSNQIYRWLNKQAIAQARKDPASDVAQQQRTNELLRENQYLRKQVEFLKKAATYFASQSSSDSSSSNSTTEHTR
jgi:transposase